MYEHDDANEYFMPIAPKCLGAPQADRPAPARRGCRTWPRRNISGATPERREGGRRNQELVGRMLATIAASTPKG